MENKEKQVVMILCKYLSSIVDDAECGMKNAHYEFAEEIVKLFAIPDVVFSEAELCDSFIPMKGLTSETICSNCGKEKWEHEHN